MAADPIHMIQSLLHLRVLVLALGERHQWWASAFMDPTGVKFLDYIFPKTKYSAALNAASAVAREAHDKVVGAGKYHLFCLPEIMEEKLFQVISQNESAAQLFHDIAGKEMERLEFLTAYIAISEQEGPVLAGSSQDLQDEKTIAILAKHYYEAFLNNYKTYPYFKW